MALVRCPDCGKEISSEAPACVQCGRPMRSPAPPPPPAAPAFNPAPGPPPPPAPIMGMPAALFYIILFSTVAVLIGILVLFAFNNASPPTRAHRITAEEKARMDQLQREAVAAANAEWQKTPAGKVWLLHQNWPRDICEAVSQKKIRIGMTTEQVVAAWGKPDDINRTVGTNYVHEQWVYYRSKYKNQYVYFEDGIMTSFQD